MFTRVVLRLDAYASQCMDVNKGGSFCMEDFPIGELSTTLAGFFTSELTRL